MAIYSTQYRMVNGYMQPVQVDQFGTPAYGSAGTPLTGNYLTGSGGTTAAGGTTVGGANATGGGGTTYNSVLDYARDAISRSPQVASPTLQQASLSTAAQNYPTWMRNLGEIQSQDAFQSQVNQGIRQGNAGNAYQNALRQRNTSRLGYMGQAGQAQLGVDTTQAGLLNDYQRMLLQRYGLDIGQRESDLGTYRAAMTQGMSTAGRSGSGSTILGPSAVTAYNNAMQGDAGVFKGMDSYNFSTVIPTSTANYSNY